MMIIIMLLYYQRPDLDNGSGERVFDTARWPAIAQPFLVACTRRRWSPWTQSASASHSWRTCVPPLDSTDAKRGSTSL